MVAGSLGNNRSAGLTLATELFIKMRLPHLVIPNPRGFCGVRDPLLGRPQSVSEERNLQLKTYDLKLKTERTAWPWGARP